MIDYSNLSNEELLRLARKSGISIKKELILNHIYQGNNLDVLKTFPDESIDCVVTSPPYWALRDYGTATWVGGDLNCDHVANQNATKKFGNDEFNKNRPSREETKTSGYYADICPKCGAIKKDFQLGLEQTFQEYVNKLCDIFDEIKRVLKDTGTCWVNIGDTYDNTKLKSLSNIPARFAIEMTNRGWILRNEIIWSKPNAMPSSAKDRFTVDFEKVFFFTKNKKYYFETQYEPYTSPMNRWGGDKLKANGDSAWDEGTGQSTYRERNLRPNDKGRIKRCVWTINTKPLKEAHFATFPELLVEPMIKAGCPDFVCNKCKQPRIKILESLGTGVDYSNKANYERQIPDKTVRHAYKKLNAKYIDKGLSDCGCNKDFSSGIVLDPFMGQEQQA